MAQSKEQIFKLGNSEFYFSNQTISDILAPLDWDVKIQNLDEYKYLLAEARMMVLSYDEMENIPSVELAKILKLLLWMEGIFSAAHGVVSDDGGGN